MTDQEEENIQEEFSMSYEKNDTNGKVLYIFLIIFLIIVICFAAGFAFYWFLQKILRTGPSGRGPDDFMSVRLTEREF